MHPVGTAHECFILFYEKMVIYNSFFYQIPSSLFACGNIIVLKMVDETGYQAETMALICYWFFNKKFL